MDSGREAFIAKQFSIGLLAQLSYFRADGEMWQQVTGTSVSKYETNTEFGARLSVAPDRSRWFSRSHRAELAIPH